MPSTIVDLHDLATVVMMDEDSFEKFDDYQQGIDDAVADAAVEQEAEKVLVY